MKHQSHAAIHNNFFGAKRTLICQDKMCLVIVHADRGISGSMDNVNKREPGSFVAAMGVWG
jgi:hypothetical protein